MKTDTQKRVDIAKNKDEPLFVEAAKSGGTKYRQVVQIQSAANEKLDTMFHIDILASVDTGNGKCSIRAIDVKSINDKNLSSGNYSLGDNCVKYIMSLNENIHYFAFRLVENNVKTGKFLVVSAKDVINKCNLTEKTCKDRNGSIKMYYLVSISDIKEKCAGLYEIIEPDIPVAF